MPRSCLDVFPAIWESWSSVFQALMQDVFCIVYPTTSRCLPEIVAAPRGPTRLISSRVFQTTRCDSRRRFRNVMQFSL